MHPPADLPRGWKIVPSDSSGCAYTAAYRDKRTWAALGHHAEKRLLIAKADAVRCNYISTLRISQLPE